MEDTKEAIDKLVKGGKAPASLARVSEKLTSAQGLARRSTTATQGDVESRPTLPRNESLQDTMSELQAAVQVRRVLRLPLRLPLLDAVILDADACCM